MLTDYHVHLRPDADDTPPRRSFTPPNAERLWKRYFEALGRSALTGMFDIIAHPDLVKIWGPPPHGRPLPDTDPRRYYEPAIEAMLEANVAMEVSTAGLRKPVGEIYPAR